MLQEKWSYIHYFKIIKDNLYVSDHLGGSIVFYVMFFFSFIGWLGERIFTVTITHSSKGV